MLYCCFFPPSFLCFLQIDVAIRRDVTTNQNLAITGNIQEEILNLKTERFFFFFFLREVQVPVKKI